MLDMVRLWFSVAFVALLSHLSCLLAATTFNQQWMQKQPYFLDSPGPQQLNSLGSLGPQQLNSLGSLGPQQLNSLGSLGPQQLNSLGSLGPQQSYSQGGSVPQQSYSQGGSVPQQSYSQGGSVPQLPVTGSTTVDKCTVDDSEKVPCGEPTIDAAGCGAINCCFDGHHCYYGRTVTVQCTIDGQFVVVVARDTTLPRLSLDSITLIGGSGRPCGPADYTASFVIYQFPVTACGTRVMVTMWFENKMISSYEVGVGPLGAITRDSQYELYFQCQYSAVDEGTLTIQPLSNDAPLPVVATGPLRVELRLGNGQCAVKGCPQEQVAYTSYYQDTDYPVTKVLRDPVFIEVHMLARTDPNIALVLGQCWATSTADPFSVPQWDLLVNGCPYQDDRYLTTVVPINGSAGLQYPGHYKRFVLKMFAFVDLTTVAPLQETVFIHCSTAVCQPTAHDDCEPKCSRQRRDVAAAERTSHRPSVVVSSGEVIIKVPQLP